MYLNSHVSQHNDYCSLNTTKPLKKVSRPVSHIRKQELLRCEYNATDDNKAAGFSHIGICLPETRGPLVSRQERHWNWSEHKEMRASRAATFSR